MSLSPHQLPTRAIAPARSTHRLARLGTAAWLSALLLAPPSAPAGPAPTIRTTLAPPASDRLASGSAGGGTGLRGPSGKTPAGGNGPLAQSKQVTVPPAPPAGTPLLPATASGPASAGTEVEAIVARRQMLQAQAERDAAKKETEAFRELLSDVRVRGWDPESGPGSGESVNKQGCAEGDGKAFAGKGGASYTGFDLADPEPGLFDGSDRRSLGIAGVKVKARGRDLSGRASFFEL